MKKLTEYQRKLVEENLEIVDWVIKYRIKVNGNVLQTHEDFFAIGCEAVCRAALVYNPDVGPFSPLGSRYVFNAIIDHCRKQNIRSQFYADMTDENGDNSFFINSTVIPENIDEMLYLQEVKEAFVKCKGRYSGVARRGMEAMELKSLGYTTHEIAQRYETSVNSVNAWISRARSYLMSDPEFRTMLS